MFREYLGCGQAPQGFDAAEVVGRLGYTQDARVEAGELYRFAAAGFVFDAYRVLFPWCPRWWLEHGDSLAAAGVELMVRNRRHGLPATRGLTAWGESLVCAHEDHIDRLEVDRIERERPEGKS